MNNMGKPKTKFIEVGSKIYEVGSGYKKLHGKINKKHTREVTWY